MKKLEIKERAELSGQSISSYARDLLFSSIIQKMTKITQI